MKALDRTDFAIISQLQNNARLSNKDLARRVDLAPSSCHARVKALEKSGVIRGYHADVAELAMGVEQQALYFISLTRHSRDACEKFLADMSALPQVMNVYLISGKIDYVLHVAEKDTASLRNFALDNIAARPEIASIETALVFEKSTRPELPNYQTEHSPD